MCDVTSYFENNDCKPCPANHVCDGITKTKCDDADKYVKDNKCVKCPTGATCNDGKATCDEDKYIENEECKPCPADHVCDGITKIKLSSGKTDLLPGSQDTASGVCNLVVSMLIAISMLL